MAWVKGGERSNRQANTEALQALPCQTSQGLWQVPRKVSQRGTQYECSVSAVAHNSCAHLF